MRGRTITPAVLALIGLALLLFESIQAMRSVVLGSVGTTLLFVGLGLIVIAAIVLVVGVAAEPQAAGAPGEVDDTPAVPVATPKAAATPKVAAAPKEADVAAGWTVLCSTSSAGSLDAGGLHASVRRGADLVVYQEGVLIGIGKAQRHRTWAQVTAVTALLGGNKATITVQFNSEDGSAEATFTGKSGDLAPAATALVSAAPDSLVDVTYS